MSHILFHIDIIGNVLDWIIEIILNITNLDKGQVAWVGLKWDIDGNGNHHNWLWAETLFQSCKVFAILILSAIVHFKEKKMYYHKTTLVLEEV